MISCYKELIFMLCLKGEITLPMERNVKYLFFYKSQVPGGYPSENVLSCYNESTVPIYV